MRGKLYSVGIGPGDPELLTLKAVRLLKECDVVALPKGDTDVMTAKNIVNQVVDLDKKEQLIIYMPMTKDMAVMDKAHQEGADAVIKLLDEGKNVVFITLGTGVGGGIIASGELVHGVAGAGGEIGHICVDPDGFECTCGNKGCLETVASATGVVRLARHLAEGYEGNSSIKAAVDNGEQVTSKDIFVAAAEGDKFANSIVDKVSEYLGLATANISNILNPDSVVIGGGVSAAGEFLRSRVEGYFTRYAFPQVRRTTKVKLAELGNDAGIIGAASLALTIDN